MRSFFVKGLLILSIIIMGVGIANADTWLKTIGADNTVLEGLCSIQTIDGGYIFAGYVSSPQIDGASVMKFDASGNIQWQKIYGPTGYKYTYARSIVQTSDGGYIITGETQLKQTSTSKTEVFVIKLDSAGNVQWYYAYGGNVRDGAYSILQTSDGGYIFAGWTQSFGVPNTAVWVVKLDANGNIQWEKSFGGSSGYDHANSIRQTSEGGYIVGGGASSIGAGSSDAWLIKIDSTGNIQWQKTYGGINSDGVDYIQTFDGGMIISGYTSSNSTDSQAWLLKLDANGNIQWQKAYNGTAMADVYLTDDGGFLLGGMDKWYSGSGVNASNTYFMKLDGAGTIQWQKRYAINSCSAPSILLAQAFDGGYIAAGSTSTFHANNANNYDNWIMKLDSSGNLSGTTCNLALQSNITAINTNAIIKINPTITFKTTQATITSSYLAGVDTQATMTTRCISNATNNCAATLSNELSLHVPVINFNNNQAYYWADFAYVPNTMNFTLTNAGVLTDTNSFSGCSQSTLSANLNLHVPKITFGSASYWADLQYAHDLLFTLTGVGQN